MYNIPRVRVWLALGAMWLVGVITGVVCAMDTPTTPQVPAPAPRINVIAYCPTEDTCAPVYTDGRWTLMEVTP